MDSADPFTWDPEGERPLDRIISGGVELKKGDRVRLRPLVPAISWQIFTARCAASASFRRSNIMDSADPFTWDPEGERPLDRIISGGVELKKGDRVRLRPLGRADLMDIALDGKSATIVAIEQDYEDRIHLAVTIDDDPGHDLGRSGQPGHRFYFGIDEVETQQLE